MKCDQWAEYAPLNIGRYNDLGYGGGVFIACGNDTGIDISRDGKNWETITPAANVSWQKYTYGNGKHVLIGRTTADNTVIVTSGDGEHWTTVYTGEMIPSGLCFGLSKYHYELEQQARNSIAKYKKVYKIKGQAVNALKPIYGEDYNLGDIAEIKVGSIVARERITKVKHVYEPDGITITPLFGQDYYNIRQIISRAAATKQQQ